MAAYCSLSVSNVAAIYGETTVCHSSSRCVILLSNHSEVQLLFRVDVIISAASYLLWWNEISVVLLLFSNESGQKADKMCSLFVHNPLMLYDFFLINLTFSDRLIMKFCNNEQMRNKFGIRVVVNSVWEFMLLLTALNKRVMQTQNMEIMSFRASVTVVAPPHKAQKSPFSVVIQSKISCFIIGLSVWEENVRISKQTKNGPFLVV